MRFSNSVFIRRPPAQVFAYLANPEHIPRWNVAISEAHKASPGPMGVGTRIRQRRTAPRPSEETLEVTAFEPERRLALRGDLGPLRGSIAYELAPEGDGTRLTNEADLEARGPLRLVAPLAGNRVRAAVGNNLTTLCDILETERG